MYDFVKEIIRKVEPLQDHTYGPQYRCSLTLKDGTFLPCAILHSRRRLIEFAKRRILEEMSDQERIVDDPFSHTLSVFVASGNRVNDHQVSSASESKYAIPPNLLSQIHSETSMGWTGWVFRMNDGKLFSYGSTFNFEFFELPENYSFADVAEVINHSFVDTTGAVRSLKNGEPENYVRSTVFRERVHFMCAVDGID